MLARTMVEKRAKKASERKASTRGAKLAVPFQMLVKLAALIAPMLYCFTR